MAKMGKKSALAIILTVTLVMFVLGLLLFLLPDQQLSLAERRKLEQMPVISAATVFSGHYMSDLEHYFLDQFPFRDSFRAAKAFMRFEIFRQKDNNDIYLYQDNVFKLDYRLQERQVGLTAAKINQVYQQFLQGLPVYYGVIPDKNYFVPPEAGYPRLDYAGLLTMLQQQLNPKLCYIDIFDCLSLDDYYRTDTHWRQEAIFPVANRLVQAMGGVVLPSREDYQQQRLYPFYGVYCGQSALPVPPDELIYLSADSTAQSVVRSVEEPGQFPVYTVDKFTGLDGYDVFLSGPSALLTIENPVAATERELVLFRDSFASSLTPLLLANYAKITLVDLRYFAASLLGDYVQFTDADVLFLYSTSLINNGSLLK